MSNDRENIKALYETLAGIVEPQDMELFFEDLCTYKEIESMAQRIKAAKMLLAGSTYEEIIKETNISSATLSRVSKCVKYGKGYKKIIQK
ncbi:MAG: TrpR-related protein YerC/YecD [Clostridia bacterium]|nr:TrpR-related protein YerC/YecD [Clostridia bacterium]MBR3684687.1 TrpR-related protein YerC/YecD [Clostridia bacterium]